MRALFGLYLAYFCVVTSVSSLEEGSSCVNFDGSIGVCEIDRTCKWALEKLKSKEIRPSQLVRCGLKGSSSIICCKDESAITTKSPTNCLHRDFFGECEENPGVTANPITSPKQNNLRKCEQACELIKNIKVPTISFHIINGVGADVGEFPHMAAIGYGDEVDENLISFDCGGSLIAKNFVMTAGHCVNNRNRQPKMVRLGRVSLVEDEGDPNKSQDLKVKKVILHPSYSSRRKYNDIALLELEGNVEIDQLVKPACLYTKSSSFDSNQFLEISGWGRTSTQTNEKSNWLLKANITERPLPGCREIYNGINLSQLPDNLHQSQLCASQTVDGKIIDACQGDSGGPLQYRTRVGHEDVFYIVGVTSFGASCGSDIPGVYTRVSEYLEWIEQTVWPAAVTI